MPFEISCFSCGTVLRTSGARIGSCPACGAVFDAPLANERRAREHIPAVRDWVTSLRLSGGDFSREAAQLAQEAAWLARRSGGSVEDAFQTARVAYYEALRQDQPLSSADN